MLVTFYFKQRANEGPPLRVRYDIESREAERLKADFQSYLATGAPSSGSYECTTIKGDPGIRRPRKMIFFFEQIASIE